MILPSRIKKAGYILLIILAILILFNFVSSWGIFNTLTPISRGILFVQKNVYQLGTRFFHYSSYNNDGLIDENTRLMGLIEKNLIEKSTLETLRQENNELREQLSFVNKNDYQYILSNIIGADNKMFGNSLILDRGSADGVEIDFPVTVANGIIIGKIIKVQKNISTVLLLEDNNSILATTVLNTDRTIGVAEGELGLSLRMNLIPQTEVVVVGDVVITSGLEEKIPKGLVVGTIQEIFSTSNELFKSATIKSPIDYHKSTVVSIIASHHE